MLVPRPAATLILTRDTAAGIEVFLLQRTHRAVFMPGVYVFPGGAVDPADAAAAEVCAGLDDAAASRLLGLEQGGLGYLVAAVRESFEEAGLLLACDEAGELLDLEGARQAHFADYRRQLAAGELELLELCRRQRLRLALDRLAYFSHWITPPGPPRRYDTRFFVAVAPPGQTAAHDGEETVSHAWIRPEQALEQQRRGRFPLSSPTIRTLKALTEFPDTAALMAHAWGTAPQAAEPAGAPRLARGRDGSRLLRPGDPAYAEVSKLDPQGTGGASYEILPGVLTQLAPGVRRLTAPNPGVMTGPGTNSYLIGDGDALAVIDPGPAEPAHLEALLAASGGRIRWVLVTHTHPDHSPAAVALQAATGAELLGLPAPPHPGHDRSFRPDRRLGEGDRLTTAAGTLRVLHTPGHASNHLCYLLQEAAILFSGDHIMQGSTVVIAPPDGDMAAYLASLERLQQETISYIAPAHGFLMDRPYQAIDRIIAHRLAREGKVMAVLREVGGGDLEALLPAVYDDVPRAMHRVAGRSLLAHLLKLQGDGLALEEAGRWRPS